MSDDAGQRCQDQAMANCITKVGFGTTAGLGIALVVSVLRKKPRTWPILVGFGYGLGQGVSERDFAYNAYKYKYGVDLSKNNVKNTFWADENGNCKAQMFMCQSLKKVKNLISKE